MFSASLAVIGPAEMRTMKVKIESIYIQTNSGIIQWLGVDSCQVNWSFEPATMRKTLEIKATLNGELPPLPKKSWWRRWLWR
jgi:hypothetical protein